MNLRESRGQHFSHDRKTKIKLLTNLFSPERFYDFEIQQHFTQADSATGVSSSIQQQFTRPILRLARNCIENQKKRKCWEKLSKYNGPLLKRPKIAENAKWSNELKAIAVEELYNIIPLSLRDDYKA